MAWISLEQEVTDRAKDIFDTPRDVWVESWSVQDSLRDIAGRPTSGMAGFDLDRAKELMLVSLPISEIATRHGKGAKIEVRDASTVIGIYEAVTGYLDARYRKSNTGVHLTAVPLDDIALLDELAAYLNYQYWTARSLRSSKVKSSFGRSMLGGILKSVTREAEAAGDKKEEIAPGLPPAYRHRLPDFMQLRVYAEIGRAHV